jgi:superfamily II DNA/RNA helicase
VRHGFSAVALHGDLDQSTRTAALDQFRRGEVALLIASDVAARGLDIPDVSHVLNFDVPHHADDYVHRIGRTGRAGRSGTAITVVTPADQKNVAIIEKLIGQPIPWMAAAAGSAPEPAEPPPAEEAPRRARREPRAEQAPRRKTAAAPVTRIDAARHDAARLDTARLDAARLDAARPPRRAPKPVVEADDDEGSHLPAFLLRPVRLKA